MTKFLVSCLLFMVSQAAMALAYTIEMSESEVQQMVSARMPMQKKWLLGSVKMSEPKIILVDGSDAIAIAVKVQVRLVGGITFSGWARIKGPPSYDSKAGEFFMRNPALEELTIDKLPEKYHRDVQETMEMVAQKVFAEYPIYKLKGDLKSKLAKAVLKSVSIRDQKLFAVLGY